MEKSCTAKASDGLPLAIACLTFVFGFAVHRYIRLLGDRQENESAELDQNLVVDEKGVSA